MAEIEWARLRAPQLRALAAQDAVVIVTAHSGVDYGLVLRHADLIVDTRGVLRGGDPHVIRA